MVGRYKRGDQSRIEDLDWRDGERLLGKKSCSRSTEITERPIR